MEKTLLSALLIFISGFGNSQTNISGGIYQNTSWSPSGNPYIASGNIVVFEDVILTIEPGVIIKFNTGASLEIRGTLNAIGNAQDSIEFTSNLNSPAQNSWKGIIVKGNNNQAGTGNQVSMDYCIGKYAYYFIDLNGAHKGPYVFRHCYFGYNFQTNDDGGSPSTIFENCRFDSNHQGIGYFQFDSRISNCEFVNNEFGVEGADIVESCYFSNNSKTAVLSNGIVQNCTIINNNVGVDCPFGAITFVENIVMNNIIGIKMQTYANGYTHFTNNTICNNSTYNLQLFTFSNANIPYNCWCSTDSAFIRSTIYDGYVNTNYGLIKFTPIEDECPEINVSVKPDLKEDDILIEVFPNPFSDELKVMLNTPEEGEVILYDLNGMRLLSQKGINIISLNTNHLPSGIFIYEVKAKGRLPGIGRVIKVQ